MEAFGDWGSGQDTSLLWDPVEEGKSFLRHLPTPQAFSLQRKHGTLLRTCNAAARMHVRSGLFSQDVCTYADNVHMPYSQKTGFDTLRVACNRLQPTCMKQNMTASGARCWVISAMPPSPASSTVSFLTPSGPYPKITLHQNKASCLVCAGLAVPSECPCGHQISSTARAPNIQRSCVLHSAIGCNTNLACAGDAGCPREAEHACEGNAPGHLTLGIAHVGNDLPDIPFVLPSHFASHSR